MRNGWLGTAKSQWLACCSTWARGGWLVEAVRCSLASSRSVYAPGGLCKPVRARFHLFHCAVARPFAAGVGGFIRDAYGWRIRRNFLADLVYFLPGSWEKKPHRRSDSEKKQAL